MNTSGFIRGLMAKNVDEETFLTHVVSSIEKQLKEWDEYYVVRLVKLTNYVVVVQNGNLIISVPISKSQLISFQSQSPYSLDRYIWNELHRKAVMIGESNGNYLTYVFH
ncbi:hypothetical protein [Ornithinibacillus halotolerans]|uniref:Uncharacterized protein n=1 Tax=Ornithinibacillus halotolerans TaxID=1274357 RepID=A0A916SBK2_9BACI|nr:hypothetical protein [Ornithinibacillus halotolerans]GGA93061.1 hypothetical protein GCM10008025_39310 [Ornithinibacillus halotolerans]